MTAPDRASAPPPAPRSPAADDIFADFVRRSYDEGIAGEGLATDELHIGSDLTPSDGFEWIEDDRDELVDPPPSEATDLAPAREGTEPVVLLTQKKSQPAPEPERGDSEITVRKSEAEILATAGPRALRPQPLPDIRSFGPFGARAPKREMLPPPPRDRPERDRPERDLPEREWQSVVPERPEAAQRVEAARLVPDVASVPPPAAAPQEGSEDGQMPSGELDRKLADMDVLLRYGHAAQVARELEALRLAYPGDLLLVRRIAELYVTHDMRPAALDMLFTLALGLFERRNVEGMRRALEQVLVLDPGNRRATRLLGLLAQRSEPGT